MIRPLRRRHRRIISVLAVLLPLAFIAGIASRKSIPAMAEIPPAIRPAAPEFTHLIFEQNDLWGQFDITTRVYADTLPPSRLAVELHPQRYLGFPDLLVYWNAGAAGAAKIPPQEAFLIGVLSGREKSRFLLPATALETDGSVILYSLAQQQRIATAALPSHSILSGGNPR